MNSINVIGNMTRDPEVRSTQTGASVCSFTVAVRRPHTSEITDFLNVTAWRQSADFLGRFAHKGSKVAVTGYLTSRTYEDNNGQKRTVYEIVADNVELCESRAASQGQNNTGNSAKPQQTQNLSVFEQEMADDLVDIDDLPF